MLTYSASIVQAVAVYAHHSHWTGFSLLLTKCLSAAGSRYRLRLINTVDYVLLRTRTKFRQHYFCYSSPAAFNSLPSDLHNAVDISGRFSVGWSCRIQL